MQKNINKTSQAIRLMKVFMSPHVKKDLIKVLYSGFITQGPQVDAFEEKLQKFIGNPYVFTVNSGTSALLLSLRLANVGFDDEVVTTPMTCTATNWSILAVGAKIVWADIDPNTGNIDPSSIKKRITKKTKAIVIVDWGGYPCDTDEIRKVAGNIPIIEDAAHAIGAMYKGKMIGTVSDFTCFSFQAIKHLTCGDGGAIAVRKKSDFTRGKLLRWYGIDRETERRDTRIEEDIKEWGYKFHMNDINATIGLGNIKHLPTILQKHRENAYYYKKELQNVPHIKLLKEDKNCLSSYWIFTIRVEKRRRFFEYMRKKGIMVSQAHRRNDTHPTVARFKRNLPGVDEFTKDMICIPVGWWVTPKQRAYIVQSIKKGDWL